MQLWFVFQLYGLLRPLIDKHRNRLDSNDYRDFVEAYLQEMEKNKNDPDTVFNSKLTSYKVTNSFRYPTITFTSDNVGNW